MNIAIINGPNLNLLGKREPDVYGNTSFEDYLKHLRVEFPNIDFIYFQSNVEGEIVTEIQKHGFSADGILLNAGAYTHTSVAIADAVAAVKSPVIEIHISNVAAREDFRKHSYLSSVCSGTIFGFGLRGYELGVRALTQTQY